MLNKECGQMAGYKLSKRADIDIANIYENTIQNFGLLQARKYYAGLIKQLEDLSKNPKSFRERQELPIPLRVCPYESHVVLYTIKQDNVYVVRVRHEREDWL